jgi:hypothetical protein
VNNQSVECREVRNERAKQTTRVKRRPCFGFID